MSRTHSVVMFFALLCTLVGGRAEAVQRAHVATYGLDSNTSFNCSVANPCRFFQAATTVVDPNGEVVVLDSGGYGGVTLTQSISLIAPTGVYAGISVFPGAHGVTIATAGVKVVLRGLTINGQGGNRGINMTNGAKLTVENCVISNLSNGIVVATAAIVRVTDTTIRDNSSNGLWLLNGTSATVTRATISGNPNGGITVDGNLPGTTTTADIADSTMVENFHGVRAYSNNLTAVVKVSVHDSRLVQNGGYGAYTSSASGAAVTLSLSNNIVSNRAIGATGIASFGAGSKVWASGNTVSDNGGAGLLNQGGVFESAGNNAVRNNNPNASLGITTVPTM